MTAEIGPGIISLKTITLLLGGSITWFAYRAASRTGAKALQALAIGFAIVTVGAILAGIVDQILAMDASTALVVESTFTAIGFGTILYSLHVGEGSTTQL